MTKETNIDFVTFAKQGLGLVFVIHDFNGSEGDIVNHDNNKSTRNLQVSSSSKIRKVFVHISTITIHTELSVTCIIHFGIAKVQVSLSIPWLELK